MVKLIYRYSWGGEPCSGTAIIPFQYKSKDDFVYDVLKRFDKKHFKKHGHAELFGEWLTKEVVDDIENNIYTLEEWFSIDTQRPFAL
jgi:hypothetical protein